ncbi:hypothetical protein [Rhizobium sp. LEGMi135b]
MQVDISRLIVLDPGRFELDGAAVITTEGKLSACRVRYPVRNSLPIERSAADMAGGGDAFPCDIADLEGRMWLTPSVLAGYRSELSNQ